MKPFVSALGAGLGLTSKEIADVIWLALQMQDSDGAAEKARQLEALIPVQTNQLRPSSTTVPPQKLPDKESIHDSQTLLAEVHLNQPNANQTGFGKQLALKVPDARSLREPLSLARALKPLLRQVVIGWSTVLDEAATVERMADEQLWLPVLKPALEPWLDLALVIDKSVSMQIWQQTITELHRLLSHYGVFRDVRVWGLVTDEAGRVRLHPGIGVAARWQVLRRPSELIDPSGRRLILVATDCVSSSWRDGSLLSTLKLWTASGPLAILQMLPEWLWSRTGLGFASAVRLQSLLPGVPNQQLVAKDLSPWDEVDLDGGIKVPVVTLEPEPFEAWTETIIGKGGAWSPGFVFESKSITPNGAVGQIPDMVLEGSAEQRVQRFRVTASPMARRLAGLLAAAPVISLPVVRIIQDRLLANSRQVHVAEVFLGGLLKPLADVKFETNLDVVQYDFLDGVREVLLDSVPTSDSVSVLEEVSKYVAERLGFSLDTFAAVLRNPQHTENWELATQSRPFAIITAQILRQLGGQYTNFAEELEQPFSQEKLFTATLPQPEISQSETKSSSPMPYGHDEHDDQRRFFANRSETSNEGKVYDYIRSIANLEDSEFAVQSYYDFLLEGTTHHQLDPDNEARNALKKILESSEMEAFLPYLINRCFYTIANLWWGQVGRHAYLQALVEKAEALPNQTPQDQLVKRLRKAMQTYVNDETLYTLLKRQFILLRPETLEATEATCLGDTFKSYFFIYESAAVTRDIPVEYRRSIRQQRQAKAQLLHQQLRQYQVGHQSGESSVILNPTRISDLILPQVIHTFDPLRSDSYHEQARIFAANQAKMQMLGGFQDEFHAYIMEPLIQESSRYRDNRFSRFVRDEIRKFGAAHIPLTEITITQICSCLLKLFVCNSLENPETGYFKYLIDNVGHQALSAVLLKIVLFRRKVLPLLEDRFGILFHLWEKCQLESIDWLVQSFEHMNVALALNNMTPLNYEPKILLSSR